ncbi:hypothetical protein [Niabella beijingensis]|uniref:hypothetical protein n=1 Tax=Niabella beijingensis TaxID=2872700 RepID=UPI001CBC328A|nr:hypothetical protein [Niabella beijingensis]MBZ4191173.1 hypothetical protein [Niabella beijingensis]
MRKTTAAADREERSGATSSAPITARIYDSGFEDAHDTYNALSEGSDGNIYYVLSSQQYDAGGRFYVYNPREDDIRLIGDLTELCGEGQGQAIAQGKSHVAFYESGDKLYFSTHVGYYELIDGMDRLPQHPPPGYERYPGGHILAYDMSSNETTVLATMPDGEGVVSMVMDPLREHIFCITWPAGNFIFYRVKTGRLLNKGRVNASGEKGMPGDDFRSLCRSLFIDPRDGRVYYSTAEGDICCYDAVADRMWSVGEADLKKDYFGQYDYRQPGSMSYNWRKIFWHPEHQVAYGIHGNSGYLFSFDPALKQVQLHDRLTSVPSQRSGMFDQFSYGYLGFTLGPDQETIYYLTGGPVYENGRLLRGAASVTKGAARGVENLHLVTYHLLSGHYTDHGPVFYENGERPLYVNSIAVAGDGNIYTLARINRNGKQVTDLIRFRNPLFAGT